MIAVIDSGVANLASVMAALHRLGAEASITSDAAAIQKASHVILPGVGAAPPAMAQLTAKKLVDVIRGLTQPVLGICLGMQIMFADSEESPDARPQPCLNVIPGSVRRMRGTPAMPVPHMGWNTLSVTKPHALLRDVADGSYVYYVHSFAVPVGASTIALTAYAEPFTGVAAHNNFHGCQFHPERSSAVGNQILKNFLSL